MVRIIVEKKPMWYRQWMIKEVRNWKKNKRSEIDEDIL